MKETNQAIRQALIGKSLDNTGTGVITTNKLNSPKENLIYPPETTWGPLPHAILAIINPTE